MNSRALALPLLVIAGCGPPATAPELPGTEPDALVEVLLDELSPPDRHAVLADLAADGRTVSDILHRVSLRPGASPDQVLAAEALTLLLLPDHLAAASRPRAARPRQPGSPS